PSGSGAGRRGWCGPRAVGPPASHPAAIRAALETSGAILLVLTDAANRSPHVRREVEMAFNARTPLLPVRMSGVLPSPDLEYFLSTTQWLDAGATFDDDEAVRLRAVLGDVLDRKAIDDRAWERRRRRRRIATATAAGGWTVSLLVFVASTLLRDSGTGIAGGPGPRTAVNPADGATYVWVAPGQFLMGCSPGDGDCEEDEGPVHMVSFARGFW